MFLYEGVLMHFVKGKYQLTGKDIAQAFNIPLQGIINVSSDRTGSSKVRSFLNPDQRGNLLEKA